MSISTIFLVTIKVIVFSSQFLESSTAPVDPTVNVTSTECVNDTLKQFIYERIGTSNEALAEFIQAFECAVANASIECKKGLNQVGNWLKRFEGLVADRHNDLENLVNGDPCEDRDENIKKLEIAVKDTEATVAGFKRIPEKLKSILEKTVIETIVGNAVDVVKVLESLECPENCTENALKDFIYERIATSNEALAEFIKAFECAIANASIEYKKGLNQVGNWLKRFEGLVADRHNDLENLVSGDPCEDRDENIKKLEIAVKETEATVASFKRIPHKLKAILEKTIIETIVGNAVDVVKVLESLECPENCTENALKDFIYERIGTSNEALAEFIKAFECAMANASIEYKKGLNQVGDWLKGFEGLVADRHNDLKNLVNGDPCEDRDENIKKLEIAVKDTEATVAGFKRIPEKLNATLEKTVIETIVGNAVDVVKVLESLECPENCTENALKDFIYERIGTSNEALAEFIQAFECAVANASIEYKKGLNQVGNWLKRFEGLVADRHNDLENLVNGDPCEDRDENIKKLEIAVKETEATVASFKRIPDKLKAILEKTVIETIVGNAVDVIKVLEDLDCLENSTESPLKQYLDKKIEANTKLQTFMKAFKLWLNYKLLLD